LQQQQALSKCLQAFKHHSALAEWFNFSPGTSVPSSIGSQYIIEKEDDKLKNVTQGKNRF